MAWPCDIIIVSADNSGNAGIAGNEISTNDGNAGNAGNDAVILIVVNPLRTCAARVTVVGLCVYLSVCLLPC